jgi:predicted DNA-binding transcriptional regulator AlpA
MTVDQDEILTTDEVAKLLKILESRRRPDIAGSAKAAPLFYKIGRYSRWRRSEVMAWFDAHADEVIR